MQWNSLYTYSHTVQIIFTAHCLIRSEDKMVPVKIPVKVISKRMSRFWWEINESDLWDKHELSPDYSNSVYEESKLVEEEPLVKYYQFPSSTTTTTTTTNLIPDMELFCLLDEMNGPVAFLENARDFLFQKKHLKSSESCPGCNESMFLPPCSSLKSPDGLIWRCSPCKKYKNIRTDSVLSGQKLTLKNFVQLLFWRVGSLQHSNSRGVHAWYSQPHIHVQGSLNWSRM